MGNIPRPALMLYGAAIATSVLIFFMALTNHFFLVMVIRFTAGIVSAVMMIFGSMIVLRQTQNRWVIASLYAGVGAGILLGNEYVIISQRFALDSIGLWWGAFFLSLLLLAILFVSTPDGKKEFNKNKLVAQQPESIIWWQLALIYGMAGFGYIIVATYLPFMVKTSGFSLLANHLWSIVGVAIILGCFIWVWAAQYWGTIRCLIINLLIQGGAVLMTLFSNSLLLLILSCISFGATFMGTTSLVMPLARQLRTPGAINMLGLVTLTYGTGQILGPLFASLWQSSSNIVTPAIICAAISLFIAAGICQYVLNRQYK